MATLASLGGGFITAGSWALCDATAALDSETANTALTTGNTDSSTFVPAAVAIDAVAVKIAARAAGSPSNTITITLRNSTTATNAASVTINVADIDACSTTGHEGGWYFFKLSSSHTPNGTDSYLIRATISATSTAVSLYTSATTNLSRQLRTTTTQAPAAGDKMIIGGEFTGAGTGNNIAITMDNTATTLFGVVTTAAGFLASISIGKRGTLTWGTTAATNYVLRLAGHFVVHSGGTVTMGTSGTPMPRDGTAVLEFTPTATIDSGVYILNGATFSAWGQSRTSGKDFYYTKLTADAAAAATTWTVADDTGWLSGDEIVIAASKRTAAQHELRALNANAGSSSLVVTSGLTNAHDGSAANDMQAEIILITRNVKIRSTDTSTKRSFVYADQTAIVEFQWVEFRYLGEGSTHLGIEPFTTTGSFIINKCSMGNFNGSLQLNGTSINNFTISNNGFYSTATGTGYAIRSLSVLTNSSWSITNNIILAISSSIGISSVSLRGTITGNVCAGCSTGFEFANSSNDPLIIGSVDNNTAHSCGTIGFSLTGYYDSRTITGWKAWRCAGHGITISPASANRPHPSMIFVDFMMVANSTSGMNLATFSQTGWIFRNMIAAGDSSFGQPAGILLAGDAVLMEIRFEACKFGVAELNRVAHSTADINFQNLTRGARLSIWNSIFSSSTRFGSTTGLADGSFIAESKRQQTSGTYQTFWAKRGTVAKDTTTVHSAGGSEKLTPISSTLKLLSGSKFAAVVSGGTVTFTVYVLKDGSYAGAAPRLILKRNPAAGINDDVVLDTLSVGASTWEALTGTSATVTDDVVLEAYVDCDGTAGSVYTDDWAAS